MTGDLQRIISLLNENNRNNRVMEDNVIEDNVMEDNAMRRCLNYIAKGKPGYIIFKTGVCILILWVFLAACRQNAKQPGQQPGQQQQQMQAGDGREKVPDQLWDIESSIEMIFKALDAPAAATEGEQKQPGGQGVEESSGDTRQGQGKQGQGGNQESGGKNQEGSRNKEDGGGNQEGSSKNQEGSSKNQESSGNQDNGGVNRKQGQGAASRQTQQTSVWDEVVSIIGSLHYKWNNYIPVSEKKGVNKTLLDNFGNALNILTEKAFEKNRTDALLAANNLYSYIPEFFCLYGSRTPPEIKKIRYYVRNAMLNAMTADWETADESVGSLKTSWSQVKNSIPGNLRDSARKLDFAIYELEKVVKERSRQLTDIKGRVAMSDIELLEKEMEYGSAVEGGGM